MSDIVRWIGDLDLCPDVIIITLYRRLFRKGQFSIVNSDMRKRIIDRINAVEYTYNDLSGSNLMLFLNPDERNWSTETLARAQEFMRLAITTDITKDTIMKYGISELTTEHCERYNILCCYKFCCLSNIRLDLDMTVEQILHCTRLLLYDRMTLISYILSTNISDMINMLAKSNIQHNDIRYDRLVLMSNFVNDSPPHDEMEKEYYIAWAAIRLNINLYDFEFPHTAIIDFPEYYKYEHKNPKTLSLRENFDPRLPCSCYNISTLKNLTLREGLIIDDVTSQQYYDILINQRNEITFYKGKHNNVNTESPVYYNDLDNIPDNQIISYGTYNSTTAIPMIELQEHLSSSMDFVDLDGKVIPNYAIRKLTRLLTNNNDDSSIQLRRTIVLIQDKIDRMDDDDKQFITWYRYHEDKDKIASLLHECLSCSMYMRGWDGISPNSYPLAGDTRLPEPLIFSNVSISLTRINEYDKELLDRIMNLSLYAFDNKLGGNQKRDRVNKLSDKFKSITNNDPGNVESCIRTNSNWILGTIHHYSDLIGITYGINTNDIRFIF